MSEATCKTEATIQSNIKIVLKNSVTKKHDYDRRMLGFSDERGATFVLGLGE
jgi:hypothetical protein